LINLACARFFLAPGHTRGFEMKVPYVTNEDEARKQWQALCSKTGHTEALNIGPHVSGLSDGELHDLRKVVRRAVNKINDGLKQSDFDDKQTDAFLFAGNVISAINEQFERRQDADHFYGKKQNPGAMRNAADFERHYEGRGKGDADFEIVDFLRGVAKLKSSPEVLNALSTGTDTAGGFSVPSRLMPGILSAMAPVSSLMRAGAGIIALEEGAKTFTTAAVNTIPTAAWRAEAGALATSDPAFRAVVATPRSLAFQFKISRELLADGQGITEALYTAIAQAFAKELDRVGLRGSGTAPEPRGILNTSGIQSVAYAEGTALTGYTEIFSSVRALLTANAPMPTAAIMAPRSLVKIGSMVDSTEQPVRVPPMLEPVQLIATSQIPIDLTVGTHDDCTEMYIGDFSHMYFAMRESVSVQLLQELYAGTGEIGFACHMRADVVLTYPAAFAVVTGIR
jgi:HK97 family phage major capsid protein